MCESVILISLIYYVGAAAFRTVVKPGELILWINDSQRNGHSNFNDTFRNIWMQREARNVTSEE